MTAEADKPGVPTEKLFLDFAISPFARVSAPLFLHPKYSPKWMLWKSGPSGLAGHSSVSAWRELGLRLPLPQPLLRLLFSRDSIEPCQPACQLVVGRISAPGVTIDPVGYHRVTPSDLMKPFNLWLLLPPSEKHANDPYWRMHKDYFFIYSLPFKSLGSLRNVFIFQRKALFFQ